MKCKLCLREADLENSHIISEFCFKPLYDEKHRLIVLESDQPKENVFLQKGLREVLLCRKCEIQISKYEDYAAKVFNGGTLLKLTDQQNCFKIGNIDYKLFKLFELSILWRMSISNLPNFSAIKTGPYEEKLRTLIFNEDPGKWHDFGCICIAGYLDGKLITDAIMSPVLIRADCIHIYRLMFMGFIWFYYVSNHNRYSKGSQYFLQDNGNLTILKTDLRKMEFFDCFAKELSKNFNKSRLSKD
jgi:hypothetical protein